MEGHNSVYNITLEEKEQKGKFVLLGITTYYKVIVIKTVQFWHRGRKNR